MNSPKLRFKEFNDEWKTFKIQDTFVFLSTNSLSRDSLNYNNGTIQNIHYGDIHTILPTICNVNKERLPYINYNAIYKNTNFMQENDLLIADASENYDDIGKSIEVIELDNKKIVGGLHTLLLRCELNLFAPKFKGYLFNTNNIRTQIKILSVGAKVLGISKDNLKKITFYLPNIEEQTKIANFLSLIDRKIEIQEKLVENLKLYKKGLLQKVFSNNQGWNIIKFSSIIKKGKAGGTPTSNNKQYYNGNIPFLSITDITSQGKYIYTTEKNISELGLNSSSTWIVPQNSLIYSMYASVGIPTINKIPLATSQAMFNIILNENENLEYIYYYLLYFHDNGLSKLIETGTQGNINAQYVLNLNILYPSIEEQNRIANLFSNLDRKIELETKKLQDLKTYKKGLLQQMFI